MVPVSLKQLRKCSLTITFIGTCILFIIVNWTYLIKVKDVTPAKNRDVKVVNMERRDRIRKVCAAKEEELRRNKSMVDLSGSMYIDEKHNLTYCHLFKSAFTYWSLLFQIVRGDVSATSPFDPALYRQRGREIPSLQKLPHKQRKEFFNSSFSFMFTRNPYSRLLSAYTDKFFMPNYFWLHTAPSIGKVVRRKSIPCVHDLQFNEFIRFIIDSEEKQYSEDTHFRFAFDFCDPCQYKYDFIGKLETINEDTKYLLRKMNRTAVIKALEKDPREQYINFTIKERTDMLFKINGTRWICKESFYQLQKKMWKGFQMNGIISKESKYPVTEESSNMISPTNFSDMVFNAIRDAKDGNVSRKNKAEAMVEAYSTVNVEDMDKLSELLRPDCDVFGYDCRPRKLFKDRKRIEPWYFDVTTA